MKGDFMELLKCNLCGKEYELNDGENPSDFQCECGGDLSPEIKKISTVMEKKEAGICKNCGNKLPGNNVICPKCGFMDNF